MKKYNARIHSTGNPEINLCLAVLARAKKERSQMWRDYAKEVEQGNRENVDPFAVASWVGDWWQKDMEKMEV